MTRQHLHLDLETFSGEDIKKTGVYKYVESLDFEIMLFAYAYDDEPVQVVDFTAGEDLPDRVKHDLTNPEVLKLAHNANFERQALAQYGYSIPLNQIKCTMVHTAYCGLPLSLDKVSSALHLGEDAKLKSGARLIPFFCQYLKRGGKVSRRTRLTHPKAWAEFKKYIHNDVTSERAAMKALSGVEIPAWEVDNYRLDQDINDAGILVDLELAAACKQIDEDNAVEVNNKIRQITGVENPNSPIQLKRWLQEMEGKEFKSLAKDILPELIADAGSLVVKQVLELKQRASKASAKKYTSMLNCALSTGRAHGLFQFYGANRTGRWAGRLIQLQNMGQNHLEDLDLARDVARTGSLDELAFNFESIPDTLGQLVRTALIAKPDHTFVVADYSAIEARVLAWLAGEEWRLEVFRTTGKIYEASASMMFGVPIESVTKGSPLRQKGKVSELALGYQGSVGAMMQMGAEAMGLSESEVRSIVSRWREASPNIVKFWHDVESKAKAAIKRQGKAFKDRAGRLTFEHDGRALAVTLPSGRQLFYWGARIGRGKFGDSIKYRGMSQQTKQWGWLDTYGGKLVENITQAVARDLLADDMQEVVRDVEGQIVMHVHDEMILEARADKAQDILQQLNDIMSTECPWAEGLPLNADGYITEYYKKD